MKKLMVNENEAGQRLDKLLQKYLNKASKGFIYKMLRKKNITLNGKKTDGSQMLKVGDEITLFLAEETIAKFMEHKLPVVSGGNNHKLQLKKEQIIYEDEHILLINKPSGLLSQKGQEKDVSLVELMIDYLLSSQAIGPEDLKSFRPSVCNRLDRNTSGIVIAGKSLVGLQEMSRLLKDRTLKKCYQALVKGSLHEGQNIQGFLLKDEKTNKVTIYEKPTEGASPIETAYTPLAAGPAYTLVNVDLITGRTHQIRSHLASIGYPIGGDGKYGNKKVNEYLRKHYGIKSQLLHSAYLAFPEISGPLSYLSGKSFTAPMPKDFQAVIAGEMKSDKEEG